MNTIIQQLEAEQMADKQIPDFGSGDTVVVQIKVKEGNRERLQAFEGVVIAKRERGSNSSFTVRKISHGIGVERVFITYSHQIASITVKRRGKVRQAKLYYLRELSGRKARIQEKLPQRKTAASKAETTKAAPKDSKTAASKAETTKAAPKDSKTANKATAADKDQDNPAADDSK